MDAAGGRIDRLLGTDRLASSPANARRLMIVHPCVDPAAVALTRRRMLSVMLACGTVSEKAFAQPERRVRLIVPTSAGSATDATARAIQPGLAAALGVPVYVEDIPGASGVIGLQALARAAPHDMTLVVITNSVAILPSVMKAFPFDVPRDFTPIAMLASVPMVLAVNPARVPAKNARELIMLLKSRPDALAFGSSGEGSVSHLATEMFLDDLP